MLFYYHNKITSNCQYFRVDHITDHMNPHCHTRVTSLRTAKDFFCPHCHSRMYSYGAFSVLIKDFPNLPKEKKYIEFSGHRFRCTSCGETITEDIPCQCPFTRVTWDMALWIIHLLKGHRYATCVMDLETGFTSCGPAWAAPWQILSTSLRALAFRFFPG